MGAGVLITLIISAATVSIVAIAIIQEYLLKREKIKADALIKVEEINARNRLEIEKLMIMENNKKEQTSERVDEDTGSLKRYAKGQLK